MSLEWAGWILAACWAVGFVISGILWIAEERKMSKTINGVPDKIWREDYIWALRMLGVDPDMLTELKFTREGVFAVVFAQDENGHKVPRYGGGEGEAVKHLIFIPVVDD